ncbi:MAG: helix-turn-helix domain-containing protein [Ruminococcaceae bacterium]|nr:helix-turn-helix domain-containing protein [Oscillospiraceae bacterium]
MKLNEKIYDCRKKAGLSQDALAEQIGVSRQAVSKWEIGSAQPDLDNIVALAKVFGVTTDWLLTDDEPDPGTDNEQPAEPSKSSAPAYPAWVDDLPQSLSRMLKRYGWIVGVYVSVIGAMFTGMGALGRFLVKQMFSFNTAAPYGELQITVEDGMTLTPDMEAAILAEIGGSFGYSDPFSGMMSGFMENNPVSILCGFIMIVGIVMILTGIAVAVLLKRYSE